jgi:hypothetical protein
MLATSSGWPGRPPSLFELRRGKSSYGATSRAGGRTALYFLANPRLFTTARSDSITSVTNLR